MKKVKILFVMFVAVFSACVDKSAPVSSQKGPTNSSAPQSAPVEQRNEVVKSKSGGGREEKPVTQQVTLDKVENSQNPPTVTERKIIRNADLNLEADAPEESQQKITAIAESKGGFVVESQQSSSNVKTTTRDVVTMTIRVPSAKFNEALEEIRKTASRVIVETVKSDDVTEDFIDIEAQLKAKKALEAQFLEIMKRANTVEEALNVQRQLAEVRGEIEKIEGKKRFLENQSSLSTIKVRLQTPLAFSANSSGFFYQLRQAFGKGFDAALNFILGFVTFLIAILPFLVFIVLPIYLVIRYILKKRRKPVTVVEIAKEELKGE